MILKKKLFVTGGAGFIGSNFIDSILKNTHYSVINLDCFDSSSVKETISRFECYGERFTHFTGFIQDKQLVRRILKEHKPDFIINFAAKSHVDKSIGSPAEFIETNIYGTFILLEEVYNAAIENSIDKNYFKFIQISTDEVYGDALDRENKMFLESDRLEPNSPYSATKASSEHLVHAWGKTFGLNVLITRTTNNYGPYQNPEKFIPKIINSFLNQKNIPVYGDGLQKRDWIYVSDNVDAIIKLMENNTEGNLYNISSGEEIENLFLIEKILRIMTSKKFGYNEKSLRSLIKFVSDRPGHDRHYSCDSSKLRKEFIIKNFCNFNLGLEKTIIWYKENKDWSKCAYEQGDGNDYLRWRGSLSK